MNVCEVALWDRPRSAEELHQTVQALEPMVDPNTKYCELLIIFLKDLASKGLLGIWPCDEGEGVFLSNIRVPAHPGNLSSRCYWL